MSYEIFFGWGLKIEVEKKWKIQRGLRNNFKTITGYTHEKSLTKKIFLN